MDDWGNEMFVTPGIVVDGELVTTNLVDINLGIRILLGSSYYQDWTEEEIVRPDGPARQPGRQAPPVEPDDDPEAAEARPRRRQLLVGDEPALVRQAHRRQPGDGHRRRRARAAVGDGAGRQGPHAVRERDRLERADEAAQDAGHARGRPRVEDPAVVERDRARPGADLLRRLRGGHGAALPRQGVRGDPRRAHEDVRELRRPGRRDRLRLPRGRARRALAPHGHPRRQDRQLPPVSADAVERLADRLLRHARPVRGRVQRHADLRGGRRRTTSAGSTSCARSARSTRACRAACTCTSATGKTIKQVHSPMFGEHG